MTRGNQREKAREKNMKDAAGKVRTMGLVVVAEPGLDTIRVFWEADEWFSG